MQKTGKKILNTFPLLLYTILLIILSIFATAYNNHGIQLVQGEHQQDCRVWTYDANHVPYYKYYDSDKFPRLQRNPLYISNEVIYHSENYKLTGNESSKQVAINNADWLVSKARQHGDYSLLFYTFYQQKYNLDPPWRSALAQGKAIEALARVYQVTNNQTYLETAKSLLNSFFVDIKDGGITIKTPNDGWWYEEYADEEITPPMVLNGMMIAMTSLYRYYQYTNDTDAKFLFDQGIVSLRKNLPLYDNDNGLSYYDIFKDPTSLSYHNIHIGFLDRLLKIVGDDDVLRTYRDKWKSYIADLNLAAPHIASTNTRGILSISNPLSISVKFSEEIDESSIADSLHVVERPTSICTIHKDAISGSLSLSSDEKTVIFTPKHELAGDTKYTIIVTNGVRDLDGNNMTSPAAWSFVTGSYVGDISLKAAYQRD